MAKTEIDFINREIEDLKNQMNRFIAHLESEQRVYGGHGKRLDLMEKLYESSQKLIEKLDAIVRNGNGGLQLRVDRIEQREADRQSRFTRQMVIFGAALQILNVILYLIFKQ